MQVKNRAAEVADAMKNEDGVTGAVTAFHKHFPPILSKEEIKPLHEHSKVFSIRQCFGCSFLG